MPKSVVEISTITPVFCLRLNCMRMRNNKAKTINKSSQLLVSSKRKTIERGITVPIPIPKYLYKFNSFFSSIVKNSYKPTIIKRVITRPHTQSTIIAKVIMLISTTPLIILLISIYLTKPSFSFLILLDRFFQVFTFKIRPIFFRKIQL